MPAPTILIVDDEPQVLNAVERDLRRHYRREYRIVKAGSGQEALTVTQQLKQRNDPVALFLVDQRMPTMTGTEFLNEARAFYPEARKVLLTAYADTEAAIASINRIGLDYYLMKPWDPPEQNMYPILDDLLDAWKASVPVPYDGTPALMADYAQLARDAGAKIIGGCCGTTPEHLRAMREALETRPKASEAPSLELIEAKLGPYSSETDGTIVCGHGHAHAAPRQRERTGRRRRPE